MFCHHFPFFPPQPILITAFRYLTDNSALKTSWYRYESNVSNPREINTSNAYYIVWSRLSSYITQRTKVSNSRIATCCIGVWTTVPYSYRTQWSRMHCFKSECSDEVRYNHVLAFIFLPNMSLIFNMNSVQIWVNELQFEIKTLHSPCRRRRHEDDLSLNGHCMPKLPTG